MSRPNDPEDVTALQPADLAEAFVDETPDESRPQPMEADEADTADQRLEVELDEDEGEI